MMRAPVAVTILTGFLGAGKTTLLNSLLKDPALRDTAVIINEFGEIGIDHLLVEQSADGIIELSDGCLCCTVRGELVDTLADLVERVQMGRIERLERIVVETTGLADPVPVLQSVMAHPALQMALRLDGVVAVVDAVNGVATLDRYEEARRQVALADRIVISKSDLADPAGLEGVSAAIRKLNARAGLSRADEPAGSPATLLQNGVYDPDARSADVGRWLGENHGEDCEATGHDHGHHHHHDRIVSFALRHPDAISAGVVETFLDLLRATQGDRLLRMKGIVETVEDPARPLVLHGVQQMLHPPARLPSWPDGERGARLVLIGQDLDRGYIERLFAAFVGRPLTDMPDRTALTDNPLAISGMGRFTPS